MLTAGRIVYPVIGTHAYWLAIHGGQFGPASALSLTLAPFLDRRSLRCCSGCSTRPERERRVNPRSWWRKLGHGSLLLVATVYCVFPIYFMLVQSLKTAQEDVFGNPLIVVNPTFENFEELFQQHGEARGFVGRTLRRSYPVLDWLENTIIVFAGSVAVTLVASLLRGLCARAGSSRPGFRWWRRIIFASYVIPHTILFVPLYQVVITLHLENNLLALLVVYPTLALPFCIWILSAYFQHLPRAVEESALVEGASRATAFFRILPADEPARDRGRRASSRSAPSPATSPWRPSSSSTPTTRRSRPDSPRWRSRSTSCWRWRGSTSWPSRSC